MRAIKIMTLLLLMPVAHQRVDAQEWPTSSLTMIVPFSAGGGFDAEGRIMARRMSASLGQQIIVENVGGASGLIGTARVAKASPDGYTFLLGSVGTHAYNPALYRKLSYNPLTDFETVALFGEQPMVLVTRKDFPAANLQEFIAYTKLNGSKLHYGSVGAGSSSHLGCALLNITAGLNVTQVPYRGGAPAMVDLMAGHVDYMCASSSGAAPQIANGTLKPIAVLARSRLALFPAIPTAHEQGLANFTAVTWHAFFAPKGTPGAKVKKLNEAIGVAMNDPSITKRMQGLGLDFVSIERRSPEYLREFVASEIARWDTVVKAIGISTVD